MTERDADAAKAAEAERRLGRQVAVFLPLVVVVGALGVGVVASPAPALLVLVAGALLGAITLLWASVRTLGGDAPLAEDLEALAAPGAKSDLAAEKRAVLRALKDIEHEHAIGKIDEADYRELADKYRAEAKDLLRKLDVEIEPYRAKAEALAQKHLVRAGLAEAPANAPATDGGPASDPDLSSEPRLATPSPTPAAARPKCAKCETENDADAAFCKKCGAPIAASSEPSTAAEEKHA
jgi:hypothetical protein